MTIFDFISAIAFTKNRNCLSSIDQESTFAPYLVNRWLSMYSAELALTSNKINKYLSVFDNKKDIFTLFINLFPKVKTKRINYIKKNKKEDIEKDEKIGLLAKSYEVSQREIEQYMAFLKK